MLRRRGDTPVCNDIATVSSFGACTVTPETLGYSKMRSVIVKKFEDSTSLSEVVSHLRHLISAL